MMVAMFVLIRWGVMRRLLGMFRFMIVGLTSSRDLLMATAIGLWFMRMGLVFV